MSVLVIVVPKPIPSHELSGTSALKTSSFVIGSKQVYNSKSPSHSLDSHSRFSKGVLVLVRFEGLSMILALANGIFSFSSKSIFYKSFAVPKVGLKSIFHYPRAVCSFQSELER